jgi:hypothetical protein
MIMEDLERLDRSVEEIKVLGDRLGGRITYPRAKAEWLDRLAGGRGFWSDTPYDYGPLPSVLGNAPAVNSVKDNGRVIDKVKTSMKGISKSSKEFMASIFRKF